MNVKNIYCLALLSTMSFYAVTGQPDKYLRTHNGPIPTLPEEDEDPSLDPKFINNDELREKLDLDFWPDFMSITDPGVNRRLVPENKPQPVAVSTQIRRIFKHRSRKMRKARKKYSKQKRVIQAWLAEATACRVHYRWKDIGIRNWPRYIKEGYCDTSRSCSIPAGMKCKPKETTDIHILRWYCQGILIQQQYCLWVDFSYPIVSKCECHC